MKNKKCLKCQNVNISEANFCRICGVELTNDDSFVITNEQIESNEIEMTSKYPVLKIISNLFNIFAWITGFCFFVMMVFMIVQLSKNSNEFVFLYLVSTIAGGFLSVLFLLFFAEAINLFIDIEKNTRLK